MDMGPAEKKPEGPRNGAIRSETPGSDDALKALLDELNRPLDEVDWSHTTLRGKRGEKPQNFLKRLRRERQHRRELRRARKAAARAFDVRPKISTRKRATLMLGAGALGLTAFTGPPKMRKAFVEPTAAEQVVEYVEGERRPAQLLLCQRHIQTGADRGRRRALYRLSGCRGLSDRGCRSSGRTEDRLRVGDRISERRVLDFLDADLAEAESGVRELVGDLPLHQHEFDALLDLVYNVGIGNVSPSESPRLNAAIDRGDYEGIAAELNYTHAGGRFAKGLEYRSERRAQIFLDAAYADPRTAANDTSA